MLKSAKPCVEGADRLPSRRGIFPDRRTDCRIGGYGKRGLHHNLYARTTSSVAGATVYDFEGGKPANYTGAGSVVNFSAPGGTAAPAGDNTNYYTVASPR